MIPVSGAQPPVERSIRTALSRFPDWFVKAARVSKIIVTNREDVREQIAMFEHGSRNLYVSTGIGALLPKALGHELAHGIDDVFDVPHYFTSTDEWRRIHANQSNFDIPKYRDEPLEYFADMVTKMFLLGSERLATTNPDEVQFIGSLVFPILQSEFRQ